MNRKTVTELFDLTGKVALVTGVKNLGYEAAEALAEMGAVVIMTRRDAAQAEEAAKNLASIKKARAVGVALEITDEDSWGRVVSGIIDEFGRIDILVNNAGGRNPTTVPREKTADPSMDFLLNRPLEEWTAVLGTNLTGTFLGCRTVAAHMKKQGSGKIVNIASIDGVVARDLRIYDGSGQSPTVPEYLVGKAGVIHLTRALAVVLAPFGIYVNCISPGGFFRNQPEPFVRNYERLVPLGRMARDGIDLKGSIAYLASAASDYTVGHNLIIDGGYTAW